MSSYQIHPAFFFFHQPACNAVALRAGPVNLVNPVKTSNYTDFRLPEQLHKNNLTNKFRLSPKAAQPNSPRWMKNIDSANTTPDIEK